MVTETGVAGIVLAAGASRRMGREKALLDLGGRTFLAAAVATLRDGGCGFVVAVVRSAVAPPAAAAGALPVVNDDTASQQIDSLRLGLRALPGSASAAVVLPVDHALVSPDTVRALIAGHAAAPDAIVRPTHDGRPGHPTLFPRSAWGALLRDPLPDGARSVVDDPAHQTVDLAVDDPGVQADIDTPEAYRQWVEGA